MTAYKSERARLLNAFGDNVSAERKQRNLSQERLAEIANLHRNEISILERGKCEPGLFVLLILADVLEVPLEELARGVQCQGSADPAGLAQAHDVRRRSGLGVCGIEAVCQCVRRSSATIRTTGSCVLAC